MPKYNFSIRRDEIDALDRGEIVVLANDEYAGDELDPVSVEIWPEWRAKDEKLATICGNCGKKVVPGDEPNSWCHEWPDYYTHCGETGQRDTVAVPY